MTVGYEKLGSGPQKVLLMHNWMATSGSYDEIRPLVDGDRFTFVFMDHRGYGRSRSIKGENTAREAAGDAIALAAALGWDRFDVVGHSMSAMIAQRMVLDAPDRIRSLVAVTPVSAAGVRLDAQGVALFSGAASLDSNWESIARMLTADRLPRRWYSQQLSRFRADVDPQAFLRFLRMWTTTDFSAEMNDVRVPALVLVGRQDFSAFSQESVRQTFGQWFRTCEIAVIDDAGHHPMSETPPRFVALVEQFLSRQH
jgi:pimeloyl-ACP methyl ester carboxylesterase